MAFKGQYKLESTYFDGPILGCTKKQFIGGKNTQNGLCMTFGHVGAYQGGLWRNAALIWMNDAL